MNSLYRFSPIRSEETINQVFEYIALELEKLSERIFQEKLPIDTLKIFPHYPEEYDYLYNVISKLGPKSSYTSETSYYAEVEEIIKGQHIKLLGVRIIDPYRMQVGCGDYEVDNFQEIKEKYLGSSRYVRDMKRDTDMLEVWHPDFDVLGYIVPKRI